MRIIFLDVERVLNNDETEDKIFGWVGIDSKLLNNLKELYDESNKEEETRIVISSSWKYDEVRSRRQIETCGYTKVENCYAELLKRLNDQNMEVLDFTREPISQSKRGEGILKWIEEYNEKHEPISTYVVLDDEEFDFEYHEDLYKRFIRTSRYYDEEEYYSEYYYSYIPEGLTKKYVEKALKILRGEIGEEDVTES